MDVDLSRDVVIRCRPVSRGRMTSWELHCDECGSVQCPVARSEKVASRYATLHSEVVHEGMAVIATAKKPGLWQFYETAQRHKAGEAQKPRALPGLSK